MSEREPGGLPSEEEMRRALAEVGDGITDPDERARVAAEWMAAHVVEDALTAEAQEAIIAEFARGGDEDEDGNGAAP